MTKGATVALHNVSPMQDHGHMLADTAITALASRVRGALIRPDDVRYEAARKVHNAMIDLYPQLIVRCADLADVVAAVNFARDHELPLAVRGGGHQCGWVWQLRRRSCHRSRIDDRELDRP